MDEHDDIRQLRRPIINLPERHLPAISDLPGNLAWIAEVIEANIPGMGVRITLLLAQSFPGQYIHFRTVDKFINQWRDDTLREIYDQGGITVKELAVMIGMSTREVEKILARPSSQEELEDRQFRLF